MLHFVSAPFPFDPDFCLDILTLERDGDLVSYASQAVFMGMLAFCGYVSV